MVVELVTERVETVQIRCMKLAEFRVLRVVVAPPFDVAGVLLIELPKPGFDQFCSRVVGLGPDDGLSLFNYFNGITRSYLQKKCEFGAVHSRLCFVPPFTTAV